MDVPDFRGTHAQGFLSECDFCCGICCKDLAIRDESELKLQNSVQMLIFHILWKENF